MPYLYNLAVLSLTKGPKQAIVHAFTSAQCLRSTHVRMNRPSFCPQEHTRGERANTQNKQNAFRNKEQKPKNV